MFDCVDPHVTVGSPPLNPGDVWLHDRQTRESIRVSEGAQGPRSSHPFLSSDGRVIVFMSGDRVVRDVYVRDRMTGGLTFLRGIRAQPVPRVSGDGQTVAFAYYDGTMELAIHDLRTGTTSYPAPTGSRDPSLDADGRFVAFESNARGTADIYLLDRSSGQVTQITDSSSPSGATLGCTNPALSADGRFVAFEAYPRQTGEFVRVFLRDILSGDTVAVSVGPGGGKPDGDSYFPSVSAGGRYVAFASSASNLVPGDTNQKSDVFAYDRLTGKTTRISLASDGTEGDDDSGGEITSSSTGSGPGISADGRFVAFCSRARNLVREDRNNHLDVFVAATGFASDLRN